MLTMTKDYPLLLDQPSALNGLVELQYYRKAAHSIERLGQVLRVIEGTAWVSLNGEDHILHCGETLTLDLEGPPAVISALGRTKLVYTIVD